jgi:hypothetical protein
VRAYPRYFLKEHQTLPYRKLNATSILFHLSTPECSAGEGIQG